MHLYIYLFVKYINNLIKKKKGKPIFFFFKYSKNFQINFNFG